MNRSPKGTPFQPIIESYLQINELIISKKGKVQQRNYTIPDQILSNSEKPTRLSGAARLGTTKKLPILHWYAALLLRNEISGCSHEALDKEGLLRNLRAEYPTLTAKASRRYVSDFGKFRSKYNNGQLFNGQTVPPLYCWFWNASSYIVHPKAKKTLLSFQFCRRYLESVKFADPRFFSSMELETMRQQQFDHDPEITNWHVPALAETQQIESQLQKPLYDAIEWPSGYSKNYNPI